MINTLRGLKLVSLFSGIGGLDLGFINHGCNLIWANDNNKYAVKTYRANIVPKHKSLIHLGDINKLYPKIPNYDILIGGFPCQPFSIMGAEKGFHDKRGTLFFTIEKIIKLHRHKPRILILENVRNLLSHNNGKTFRKMRSILINLGYDVHAKVLNTVHHGLPQIRRRVFVVCFLKSEFGDTSDFTYPKPKKLSYSVYDLLDEKVNHKYFLSKRILPTILADGSGGYKSKSTINRKIAKPLTATMAKMHRANQDNYYTDKRNRRRFYDSVKRPISDVRRLTPNECRKLQGFPNNWTQVVSDTQAYKQFGNAVSVNASEAVADSIDKFLKEHSNK